VSKPDVSKDGLLPRFMHRAVWAVPCCPFPHSPPGRAQAFFLCGRQKQRPSTITPAVRRAPAGHFAALAAGLRAESGPDRPQVNINGRANGLHALFDES